MSRRPSRARGVSLLVVCAAAGVAFLADRVAVRSEAAGKSSTRQEQPGHLTHALTVSLDPATHRLTVSDVVRFPAPPPDGRVEFVLNAALAVTRSEPPVREMPAGDTAAFTSLNGGAGGGPRLERYRAMLPRGRAVLSLSYEGVVNVGLSPEKEQYTRGFRETTGRIGPEGLYLAGAGFWYPQFGPQLVEFTLDVTQPEGWHVISQGRGTSRDEQGRARWESGGPTDEIYLTGGPLHRFRARAGNVETLVYLHEADRGLASKYLEATGQYIEMYRQLIGPYPYDKFALVENFWETGYGMPSFTLLGPEVIRFPFILTSSYPHEILHNWWGNSVFVDFASGNWSEGLTAYLADHLIQEQRGAGAEYRRATLQKYRDYVKDGRDFALTAFRGRESASTEAVGYGKALMAFHMLRRSVGDDGFRQALARFYRDFKGRRASFDDVRRAIEAESGRDFSRFFADWIGRVGAPVLAVEHVKATRRGAGGATAAPREAAWTIGGTLRQTQGGSPYAVDVPVAIQTATGVERRTARMDGAAQPFEFDVTAEPLALHVDPDFDVFRTLDPRETPPSIGQIFGEPRILAIVPSAAPEREQAAWRALFEGWRSEAHQIEIRMDREVTALPPDRAVWIAGRDNALAGKVLDAAGVARPGESIDLDGQRMPFAARTLVIVARHPGAIDKAVGFLAIDPFEASPGLGRKLPHYGKYSYLAFEGAEPVNTARGQWATSDSPLSVRLARDGASLEPERRKALAEMPASFSEKTLGEHVAFLADPARGGRMPGTPGHDEAAKYIAERFGMYGLEPGGDAGGFFQSFAMPAAPGSPTVANVIGLIPGARPDLNDQAVVVSAHYDHLGTGWPDVHKGDEGKVHPGADDNASGVAVMLELARAIAAGEKPVRPVVFIAFTGEEAGLLGSKHYVEHAKRFPAEKTVGAINLDTVGRLGSGRLSVLGTGTASEWPHIFRGASFVTGVDSVSVADSAQSSDQVSFVRKGVPAVQIFSGAHADYHRPSDTADKVDVPGLVKVATFTREAVVYLAGRVEPLANTIAGAASPSPTGAAGGAPRPAQAGRRASFGTIPDFAFPGPGVRVSGVIAGSPAEQAGVKEGDVLEAIDGKPVANLQAYSDLLKTLTPGQTVKALLDRAGEKVTVSVTLAER